MQNLYINSSLNEFVVSKDKPLQVVNLPQFFVGDIKDYNFYFVKSDKTYENISGSTVKVALSAPRKGAYGGTFELAVGDYSSSFQYNVVPATIINWLNNNGIEASVHGREGAFDLKLLNTTASVSIDVKNLQPACVGYKHNYSGSNYEIRMVPEPFGYLEGVSNIISASSRIGFSGSFNLHTVSAAASVGSRDVSALFEIEKDGITILQKECKLNNEIINEALIGWESTKLPDFLTTAIVDGKVDEGKYLVDSSSFNSKIDSKLNTSSFNSFTSSLSILKNQISDAGSTGLAIVGSASPTDVYNAIDMRAGRFSIVDSFNGIIDGWYQQSGAQAGYPTFKREDGAVDISSDDGSAWTITNSANGELYFANVSTTHPAFITDVVWGLAQDHPSYDSSLPQFDGFNFYYDPLTFSRVDYVDKKAQDLNFNLNQKVSNATFNAHTSSVFTQLNSKLNTSSFNSFTSSYLVDSSSLNYKISNQNTISYHTLSEIGQNISVDALGLDSHLAEINVSANNVYTVLCITPSAHQIQGQQLHLSIYPSVSGAVITVDTENFSGNTNIVNFTTSDSKVVDIYLRLSGFAWVLQQVPQHQVVKLGNTPTSVSSSGEANTIAITSTHLYTCHATNNWRRVSLSDW